MILTLMYHIVDRRIDAPIAVSEEAFEGHLAHIRREGYPVLTLDAVLGIAAGDAPVPDRALFLTFDDGYADNVSAALPRLQEHGIEATMFVPTRYVGQDNGWNERATYHVRQADWDELEQWVAGGGRVGGHTHGHEDAAATAPAELDESILLNRRLLRERLGPDVTAFAYPYGRFTRQARFMVARAYEVAFSVDDGTWDIRRDRFAINRMNVGFDLSTLDFALELERRFDTLAVGRRPAGARTAPVTPARRRRAAARPRPRGPRIVLVAETGADVLGHPVEPRFVDLLEAGWDVHLIHERGILDLAALGGLDDATLRSRLHPPPVALRRPYPRASLVIGGLVSAALRPRSVARAVHASDGQLRYRRATLLALRPDIVHVPRGTHGTAWLELRGAVPARFVGPAGAGLPGDALHASYLEFAGTVREDLPAIPPTVPPEVSPVARDGQARRGPLRLLGLGDLSWRQGYEHLLHAIRLLEDRGVPCECRILGSGPDEDAVTFARHQLGIAGAVELDTEAGPLGATAYLRWADVLVNPAVVPTRPWALSHAQALGVPFVTTPLPLDADEPSIVVERRDPVALADAVERLARDPDLRRAQSAAALARGGATVSLEEQLDRFRELYRRALA